MGVSVSSELSMQTSSRDTSKGNAKFTINTPVRRALYVGLVRPHINYATPVWAPQSIELISKLESIQRRATKFILYYVYRSQHL